MDRNQSSIIYSSIKNRITFAEIALNFILLLIFAFSPISEIIAYKIQYRIYNEYLQFLAFMIIFGGCFSLLGTALSYYSGFIIEHDFKLSNQSYSEWKLEQLKGLLLSAAISLPLGLLFYFFLKVTGQYWWIFFGIAVFLFSVLLARIAPVLIMPVFYKFTPVDNDEINNRIKTLTRKFNLKFQNIYSFNLSKNTKKANAAFTGFGKTRRIILSDTLIENFTPAEIEIIFAHELGHFKGRHIIKNILISAVVIFSSFYLCNLGYGFALEKMGYFEYHEIRMIPVLFFFLSVFSFIIMPVTNSISRHFEREADIFAAETTGQPEIFIDAMNKLAEINLADRNPNSIIEFIFHSHPSINRRIELIKNRFRTGYQTEK
ncbi:MAG: M48 family metallopeptidase [Spirochaetes bacterium]|nr:M48 family metallopeptidase [Spirochaetota bacterium]